MEKVAVTEQLQSWLALPLITMGDTQVRVLDLLSALLVFCAAIFIVRVLIRAATRAAEHSNIPAQDIYAISRMVKYIVYSLAVIFALSALGVSFSKLAIVAGALGVGIGFGLQSIVNNFVCGIIILFEKSLRIGDFIELPNGLLGEVKEINIRSTLIRTLDNADILVPNADFISNQVHNWTLKDNIRRFSVPFSVAYGSDLDQVESATLEAASRVPFTLHKKGCEPMFFIGNLSDSGIDCALSVWASGEWVKRPGLVKSQYLREIYKSLRTHQITIPFPQMDVHLHQTIEN